MNARPRDMRQILSLPPISDFLLYNIRKQVMGGTSGAYHANLMINIDEELVDAF